VVEGRPEDLKRELRGESVTVELGGANGGAAGAVEALAGVHEVIVDGSRIHARVERGAEATPAILAALDAAGAPARAVTIARPSLDDVYLHYTGRDFHADDQAGGA
jgi:ABC-2 type transport system ATP-binding protein